MKEASQGSQDIVFKTKPQIALAQLRAAHAAGIPLGTVLTDSGYVYDGQFRKGITQPGCSMPWVFSRTC